MILSASRRTDIPNYYSDWFMQRIREGFVYVRNPINFHQVSKIKLAPEFVDCIVFWTKNPKPMLKNLDLLHAYPYYFQFSITPYGQDIEPYIPDKKEIVEVFQELSFRIGKERVVWRYDPILINDTYTIAFHTAYFGFLAEKLHLFTNTCTISFLDFYKKIKKQTELLKIERIQKHQKRVLAQQFVSIAKQYGFTLNTCAEEIELADLGIGHANCIDAVLIEQITHVKIRTAKDRNQRPACGCAASVDVGMYNTCPNGCKYCYANGNRERILQQLILHDKTSPFLSGGFFPGDKITERKVKSWKEDQFQLF